MNAKLLLIIALVFFVAWKHSADDILLFCSVFATAMWVCVLIYRMETTRIVTDRDG